MGAVITVSSIPLVIMLLSFSPLGINQAQGQILFPCPNGYQHNSLGLCVPVVSSNPNLQGCPDGYIKGSSGVCELVGGSSQTINNATNQTRNQGSLLTQRPPNTGGAAPLQQPQPLQQQPVQNQTLSQSYSLPSVQQQQWSTYRDPGGIFAISYPSNWVSVPGESGSIMFRAPVETFSDNYVNAAVLVISDTLPSVTNTLQAMTEYKLKGYSVQTPDDKLLHSQGTSLSGLPAHMVVVQFLNLGNFLDLWQMAKLQALEEWAVKGDKSYNILYITPVEKFEQYLPIAQQMINSFQILS
jgi:hypothetical protein